MACNCKKSSGQVSKMKQVVKNVNKTINANKNTSTKKVVKRLMLRRPI